MRINFNRYATRHRLSGKNSVCQLLKRVGQGETFVITRNARPVARLVPEVRRDLKSFRKAVAGIFKLRQQIARRSRLKLTIAEVKAWITKGQH